MNKFGKKVLAAGICAGISLLALTGCSANKNEKIATIDGTDITLGELTFAFRYQQAAMESSLGSLFGDTNMWEQDLTGQGVPYGTLMKDSVLEDYEEMVVLEQHMADYNVELTEEEKKAISEATEKFMADNDEKTLKAMMADEDTVNRVLTLNTIRSKMSEAIEADADTNVTDEEAAQKTIQYAAFSTAGTQDEEGNTVDLTEEEIAEIKQQAQDVIDGVKGGKTLEDAVKEIDENKNVTTYSYGEDEEVLNETLKAEADKLNDGEICEAPVEGENVLYVVQMQSTFDEEATEEKKEEIIHERKHELYHEVVDGWMPEDIKVSKKWDDVTYNVKFEAPQTEASTEVTSEAASEETSETASEDAAEAVSEEKTETKTAAETQVETETETASETETAAAEETETESTTK